MANAKLGEKPVGSIVKVKINGALKDFIVVQQGLPGSTYDASCNGVWLLMKDIYTTRVFRTSGRGFYDDSDIHSYLNGEFLNLFDNKIRDAIKQVKIPYYSSTASSFVSGSAGLSTKVFLLSMKEVGFSVGNISEVDAARLTYFASGASDKRIAFNGSTAEPWWLRSTGSSASSIAFVVDVDGSYTIGGSPDLSFSEATTISSAGVRPAFVLSSEIEVFADNTVFINSEPTISSSTVFSAPQAAPFAFQYTVNDADGDALTVAEYLDGVATKTRTGVGSGSVLTFEQASTAAGFQQIRNGSHTITIMVSDGKETASLSAAFTKAVYSASVTLTQPLAVDTAITAAVLQVSGSIPEDAAFKVEVTNNAKDASPVWQDVTNEVKKGINILFANQTAANGPAFNYRISVTRGASGEGGYIEFITGAFQ